MSANGGLEDTSLVKKYEMSDEEYNKEKNTLRSYKREMLKKTQILNLIGAKLVKMA